MTRSSALLLLRLHRTGRVVVEAEATQQEAQGPCTLKLWEEEGPRSVTVEGVVFPALPKDAAQELSAFASAPLLHRRGG